LLSAQNANVAQAEGSENQGDDFIKILRRQKDSHIQHIERIRNQMPSQ